MLLNLMKANFIVLLPFEEKKGVIENSHWPDVGNSDQASQQGQGCCRKISISSARSAQLKRRQAQDNAYILLRLCIGIDMLNKKTGVIVSYLR